jgi:hypothetical protein
MLDPNGGKFGAPQCAGEAEEQQSAVTQAGQIGLDRCQNLAQDVGGGDEFANRKLAGSGRGAVHAGLVGRRRQTAWDPGAPAGPAPACRVVSNGFLLNLPASFRGLRRSRC